MSMHEHDGLAGLAAREAARHPVPETSELERLRAEVALLQQEARIRHAINDGLAAEVDYLRACVPPAHPSDYGHEAWAEAVRAEVDAERAAVVAWLQELSASSLNRDPVEELQYAARSIERGDHRREGER